jgi:hypothetical protein
MMSPAGSVDTTGFESYPGAERKPYENQEKLEDFRAQINDASKIEIFSNFCNPLSF